MTTDRPTDGLARVLRPRSVALVGASEDKRKFGGRLLHNLVGHGYAGTIYPVNPRRETLLGLACHPSVEALPEAADVAVLAVPNAAVYATLEACAERGVGGALVVSMGFAEAGEEGRALQSRIAALCRRSGLRLWGPNCMGLIDPTRRLALSSTYTIDGPALIAGSCALILQSGALMVALVDRAFELGLGFRFVGSTGNEIDVDIAELLAHFVDDPATDTIALYVEGVRRPEAFAAGLARAAEAGKPVVVLKVGRTSAGAAAALSHTASLAGADRVFDGLLAKHGAIRVDDPDLLLLLPQLLTRHTPPSTRGVALVSASGGACAVLADQLSLAGLPLAALSAGGEAALAERVGRNSARNPVDVGTPRDGDYIGAMRSSVRVLEQEAEVGAVVCVLTTAPGFAEVIEALLDELASASKPWLFYSPLGRSARDAFTKLRSRGIPVFTALPQFMAAFSAWHRHADTRPDHAGPAADLGEIAIEPPRGRDVLTEPEAKVLLAAAGIPAPREALARTPEEAAALASTFAGPVALKVISPDVPHRARVGGVALGVAREDAGARARALLDAVAAAVPDAAIDGVLVQEQIVGGIELILGSQRDPQYGPAVLLGIGGPEAERLDDSVVWPAPLGRGDVRRMLASLAHRDIILDAVPERDIAALEDAVVRFSQMVSRLADRIESFDVNPLWLMPRGRGVLAGDALAILRPGET